jgi:hypothetical protein
MKALLALVSIASLAAPAGPPATNWPAAARLTDAQGTA